MAVSEKQLNFLKFCRLVFDEFAKALREVFKKMWASKFAVQPPFIVWDDSPTVRNMLRTFEGGKTKIPTTKSIEEWDCTALFGATIYAKTFGVPNAEGVSTLNDLYLKESKPVSGSFHPAVQSSTGDQYETYALAIDQLRLLRNTLCHSPNSEIAQSDFNNYVRLAKSALLAVEVDTTFVDDIEKMSEDDFSTEEVQRLKKCVEELLAISEKISSIGERTGRIEEMLVNSLRNKTNAPVSELSHVPAVASASQMERLAPENETEIDGGLENREPSASTDNMCITCISMEEPRLPDDRNKWRINKIEIACYGEICKLLDLDDRSKVKLLDALACFDQTEAACIIQKFSGTGGFGKAKYALDIWGNQDRSHNVDALKAIVKDKMKRQDVIDEIEKWENLNVCHGCGIKMS